jgi:hypothetical protein
VQLEKVGKDFGFFPPTIRLVDFEFARRNQSGNFGLVEQFLKAMIGQHGVITWLLVYHHVILLITNFIPFFFFFFLLRVV